MASWLGKTGVNGGVGVRAVSLAERVANRRPSAAAFVHEAVLYAGDAGFVEALVPFVRAGLDDDDEVVVVVNGQKIRLLREALAADADRVTFADMEVIGRNPARIIPAWREFFNARSAGGRRVRGVGEPIWAGRSDAEIAECERHELLLNLAFADAFAMWLVCPYDVKALSPTVVDEVERTHPLVCLGDERRTADRYHESGEVGPFDAPLPDPPAGSALLAFESGSLHTLRRFVSRRAEALGLRGSQLADLLLAVNEVATNSLRHGGGRGTLQLWADDGAVLCEVRDHGHIDAPLVGRIRPDSLNEGGRGLWLVNQLCDLVQLRSFAEGSAVRMHMRLDPAPKPSR